jgi:L-aspartate oxidase
MGGVETDLWGRTTLPGLYAAGEVACTGVHGANRLASNSLLEGLVFGARAAEAMLQPPAAGGMANVVVRTEAGDRPDGRRDDVRSIDSTLQGLEQRVREVMWNAVGLLRHANSLAPAVARLAEWSRRSELALVGHLIAKAALRREESRGGHYRSDFPVRDDLHWKIHIAEQREL